MRGTSIKSRNRQDRGGHMPPQGGGWGKRSSQWLSGQNIIYRMRPIGAGKAL